MNQAVAAFTSGSLVINEMRSCVTQIEQPVPLFFYLFSIDIQALCLQEKYGIFSCNM